MKDKNKRKVESTREEIISKGYAPFLREELGDKVQELRTGLVFEL